MDVTDVRLAQLHALLDNRKYEISQLQASLTIQERHLRRMREELRRLLATIVTRNT